MTIAITGIGIVSALGIGQSANRKELLEGHSHLTQAHYLPTLHSEWPMGEVPATNAELEALLPIEYRQAYTSLSLSRNALIGAVALQEALADAELKEPSSLTLINGTTVGGMDTTENLYSLWREGDYTTLPNIRVHRAAENTAILAGLCGIYHHQTVSTACSSSLNAIITGAMMLRAGHVRQVVVGGVDSMTRVHLNGFGSLGILSQHICRPFASDRDGINLGEGAAYLVLEDADFAQQRGAKIYGYIGGYGNVCDAYHQTASSPEGDGAYNAMQQALQMAGRQPQEISYVNAHGTATPNNDASEWRAFERVFGDQMPVIESTKPLTGHTTSASGSIEVFFTLVRMQEHHWTYAMSNAFGFGGNDSSILLSSLPSPLSTTLNSIRLADRALQGRELSTTLNSKLSTLNSIEIPAMQARRMTKMVRQLVVEVNKALCAAGIKIPDAIVLGTQWGAMVPSMALLNQMLDQEEKDISPSLFMNAANNTMAGTIARLIHCYGYNITVMGTDDCFTLAQEHARLLLQQGSCKSVLVCAFDEIAEGWQTLLEKAGCPASDLVKAQVICIN